MTIIKLPACYDVSLWQGAIDWRKVSPVPALGICKATEGGSVQDPTFKANMAGLATIGAWRGAYHFHRKAVSETLQASNFITFTRGTLSPNDFICLDVEEGGETAAQLIQWLNLVEAAYPNNRILIYSRANILNAIPMTATQQTRLRKYPTWIAGYPANPDIYSDIPASYRPNANWGLVWLWQYSDKGVVIGINGNTVDLNLMSPELAAIVGTPQGENGGSTVTFYGRNKTTLTNIRNGPAGTYTDIGDLLLGDLVEADKKDATGVWWHLTKITRNGANVTLPGVESWAWGVNIEELTAPPVPTVQPQITIDLAPGSVVTIKKADGTQEVIKA